jgi:hypothetical protein
VIKEHHYWARYFCVADQEHGPVFFVSDAMMSEAKTITFSQYYRTRAEECRARGNSFRDPAARAEMFKLAIEYNLKAKEAEAAEKHTHHAE